MTPAVDGLSEAGGAHWPLATSPCPLVPWTPVPSVGGSASHPLVPFLPLPALSFPPKTHFLSLVRLCQRSPRTVPVSLRCVGGGGVVSTHFFFTFGVCGILNVP